MSPAQRAYEAYEKQNYLEAYKLWEEAAPYDTNSFINLATMHLKGVSVKRDLPKALELLKKAADKGNIEAVYYLALLFEQGDDGDRAVAYLKRAAEAGHPAASYKLGLLLKPTDIRASMEMLIKAAFGGHPDAQKIVTYVSNAELATDSELNIGFRSLDEKEQKKFVETVIGDELVPTLAADSGGIELVNYVAGERPEIWLHYLGACSGCHLSTTSTAQMILDLFEKRIDRKVVVYLY